MQSSCTRKVTIHCTTTAAAELEPIYMSPPDMPRRCTLLTQPWLYPLQACTCTFAHFQSNRGLLNVVRWGLNCLS
eukprot:8507817-Alexandrium_andersonii.AAC.1